ncbi:Rz1-like lysis system protein LysC [Aeromonas schubertii]|uniref:Rz1-like lysis system protein LysC n=1 Tax=Aeromonas schubertii TaxID=652 RepID=UPI0021E11048|nr:Rz1-like lysis system protein LysC [Aeromonas schubertii]
MLAGCSSAPPSPAPTLIKITCPPPPPCPLPAASPATNGDLLDQLLATESAWAACAARVDHLIACDRRLNAQTPANP